MTALDPLDGPETTAGGTEVPEPWMVPSPGARSRLQRYHELLVWREFLLLTRRDGQLTDDAGSTGDDQRRRRRSGGS